MFRPVAETNRFALFTETREWLGVRFMRSLSEGIPLMADGLAQSGQRAETAAVARALEAAAFTLRSETGARAQRGLSHLYDLTFRLLELNQARHRADDSALLSLLHGRELDLQILADELANAIRDHVGARYVPWLRTVDGLTRTTSSETRAPFGAATLAAAALEALEPVVSDRTVRPAVRVALLERLAPRLAHAVLDADEWLATRSQSSVEPTALMLESIAASAGQSEASKTDARSGDLLASGQSGGAQPPPAETGLADSVGEGSAGIGNPSATLDRHEWPTTEGSATVPPVGAPASGAEPPPADDGKPRPGAFIERRVARSDSRRLPADTVAGASGRPVQSGLAASLEQSLQVVDTLGWQPFSDSGHDRPTYLNAATLPRSGELELDAFAFARDHGVEPFTREARRRFFEMPRAQVIRLGGPPSQVAALDLVAAMFDYVGDDPRLPPAGRALLWRLQQPVATLAALDPGFLGDDRRSLRRLVETVAGLAMAHADELSRRGDVFHRLETMVRAVEVVAHSLQTRSLVLGEMVQREYRRAEQGIASLVSRAAREREALSAPPDRRNRRNLMRRPSLESEGAVTRRLEAELRRRLARREVPDSVQEFLLAVWLRHLRTALLRDGENSTQFQLAMQVVDDLLWTLDASGPGLSRQQLARRIPPLIRTLNQGVSATGARQEEYQPFLDSLFLMHLRRMQKVPRDLSESSVEPVGARRPIEPAATAGEPSVNTLAGDSLPPLLNEPLTVAHDEPPESVPGSGQSPAQAFDAATESSVPGVSTLAQAASVVESDSELTSAETERLPVVLAGVDLEDCPDSPRRADLTPEQAMSALQVGDWLELADRDGEMQAVKVVWINAARTVVLMLKRVDRRAVSLRASALLQRLEERSAVLLT